jgi:type 1 glutamine amidotransferase
MAGKRIQAWFVCGGKYHDIDFARQEILTLLGEQERIRTRITDSYSAPGALESADLLITYTVDVLPDEATAAAIRDWVATGKRWFALHGTNSTLKYVKGKGWDAPRSAPLFMQTLGSQFVAHPPIAPYRVDVTKSDHPLVRGIEPFDADDELYLSELHGPLEILLHTRWSGEAKGFIEKDWLTDEPRPVMYLKPVGSGEVLYLTLGHARGRYDMQPLMEEYPSVERGSWKTPAFYELLRRGIRWAARLD